MITYALGDGKKVSIWAKRTRAYDNGFSFYVLNGGWEGRYYNTGHLKIKGDTSLVPAKLLWAGEVPKSHNDTYNEAIPWIESQL